MSLKKIPKLFLFVVIIIIVIGIFAFYKLPINRISYNSSNVGAKVLSTEEKNKDINLDDKEEVKNNTYEVTHIATPENVRAVYISAWVAGSPEHRDRIIKMINDTELNAVVIDIKDSTGRISFPIDTPLIKEVGSYENRIKDVDYLIDLLHKKNIYVIGRISVFQDPYMTSKKPEWAIKRLSDGGVWKDRKGLSFLDPSKKEVRDYVISIAKASYDLGFDEINFDYIRYPSDGNMKDINYRLKEGMKREDNIEDFFKYLNSEMKKDVNIPISADLFGLTTEAKDDMGIGQVWEKAITHFDFVCPMVYPSHYPAGHMNYKKPAEHPYEVINQALKGAIAKNNSISEKNTKIRPWLQDFDLGAVYTKELIRAEMKAGYDNGINSWMLWDPRNKYTPESLILNKDNN